MAISFITAKTFPQKLNVSQENVAEIINAPIAAIDKSPILADNQDILDILVVYDPAKIAMEISRQLSRIEDMFLSKVEEDSRLTTQVRQLSTRIGTVRPATKDEDSEVEVKSLQELAREALENARKK